MDPSDDGGGGGMGALGSRLLGTGIGLISVAVLVMLPFLIPVAFYVLANAYALIKGTAFSAETIDQGVLLTLLVLSVAVFPIALAIVIGLVGRALSPKRRRA